jgi:hypothetical protein
MSNEKQRYAMALVVERDPAETLDDEISIWEDVSATLGDGNNFLEDGHSLVFLGDPFDIPTQDTYDSGQTAHAILRGVSRLRNGLPVADDAGEMSTSDGLGAEAVPPKIKRCPGCGSENICTQTPSDDRPPYACLDCDVEFETPLGEGEASALAGPYDPRRDEDNQAALDADALRHGDQVRDEVAYRERRRLAAVKAERVEWLEREGWELQAKDYERGEVTLTELLRRLNDEPDVVHQIATWLEEDAAEEAPQTTLEVPEGCTGAVMYDRQGRPSIQHDARTCPIHEDAPISDVAIGVFVQEFLKLDATAEEIGRAVRRLSV